MIEKLTEQFIGVLCVKSNDVISKVKVLEPPLIVDDWVMSTEEAANLAFKKNVNSNNNLVCVRAIQCHSGGELTARELLNHVAMPFRWKEVLFHVGSSFTVNSILQAGLIAGGKGTDEGRQQAFFTP